MHPVDVCRLHRYKYSNQTFLPVTALQAKIVNPSTGEVAPLGETGDIMVRGYCVMKGYWGDEDKTEESITEDGWYRTG